MFYLNANSEIPQEGWSAKRYNYNTKDNDISPNVGKMYSSFLRGGLA